MTPGTLIKLPTPDPIRDHDRSSLTAITGGPLSGLSWSLTAEDVPQRRLQRASFALAWCWSTLRGRSWREAELTFDERGRAVPEAGDRLCYQTKVVTDPSASSHPSVVVLSGMEDLAEDRWVHGVCVGVYQREGEVHSVCIRTPDGIVHVVGRDCWRFSDL